MNFESEANVRSMRDQLAAIRQQLIEMRTTSARTAWTGPIPAAPPR
jgi:hypothetical protein